MRRSQRPPERPPADWLAWALHFVFGLIVGAAGGLYVVARLLRGSVLDHEGCVWAVVGASLLTAAAGSHWGDRLWHRPSVWSGDEPPRSLVSAVVSGFFALSGSVAIAWAILPHSADTSVKLASQPDRRIHPGGVLVLAGLAAALIWAWREEEIYTPWFSVDRYESPALYWFILITYALLILLFGIQLLR